MDENSKSKLYDEETIKKVFARGRALARYENRRKKELVDELTEAYEYIRRIGYAGTFKTIDDLMLSVAITKQRPVKPKDIGDLSGLTVGACPVCKEELNAEMKYCSECGQRLDWGKADDY